MIAVVLAVEDRRPLVEGVAGLVERNGIVEHTGLVEHTDWTGEAAVVHKVPAVAAVALHTDSAQLAAALVEHQASWKPGYPALGHIDSMEQLMRWKAVAGRGTRLDV